jgi:hypothetical protein
MTERLPPLLQTVADVAGLEAAIKIARALGGREMHVGTRPRPNSALVRVVGQQAAAAIGAELGGHQVTWPRATSYLMRLDVLTRWAWGWSTGRIARELRISPRQVRRIVRGVDRSAAGAELPSSIDTESCPCCGRRWHGRPRHHRPLVPGQLPLPLPSGDARGLTD